MTYDNVELTMSSSKALPLGSFPVRSLDSTAFPTVNFLSQSVPKLNQHILGDSIVDQGGLTVLNERKRIRDATEEVDMYGSEISRIRMKPDILTFYRTPGAFKFCHRISSGPAIECKRNVQKVRRNLSRQNLEDYFHTSSRGSPLPENVVVQILSYLNKRDLCNAMATCKLLYTSGWVSFNDMHEINVAPSGETSPEEVEGWPYHSSFPSVSLEYPLMLTHLDLSRAVFSDRRLLVKIMKGCARLQALSMEGQDMGEDALEICSSIGQNHGLTRLDLSMTIGITAPAAQKICSGCTRIQHMNLSWSSLDQKTVLMFCSNFPDTITRLNMAGSFNKSSLDDAAVERLVMCCPNLKELDLSDNVNITEKGLQCLISLCQLESLSLNRCYGIQPMNFLMCGNLYALNVFGCITDSGLAALKDGLNETEVNGAVFNYIAKPTVPPAITSIWGQRTKDFY